MVSNVSFTNMKCDFGISGNFIPKYLFILPQGRIRRRRWEGGERQKVLTSKQLQKCFICLEMAILDLRFKMVPHLTRHRFSKYACKISCPPVLPLGGLTVTVDTPDIPVFGLNPDRTSDRPCLCGGAGKLLNISPYIFPRRPN